ncbi:hypothetical protein EW146_g5686 [Bondarzewia mesenterica]|uniref:Uncharacterized protein n=1 Tax=Bondarzewia mesenterica TaxID=1095465 RepID=A0A4S4LWH2_9AGAM|nr:hypothetical protein EW146_g5686 [Bondarzewia mesenterica]
MAPTPGSSLLFHPKPKKGQNKTMPPPRPVPPKIPISEATPIQKAQTDDIKWPEEPYDEYKLVSSCLNGWKYDVMKFDSRKPADILTWSAPVKLNRKELRRSNSAVDGSNGAAVKAMGAMMGPDGKPVIGMDGRIVMVDAEGKPIHPDSSDSSNVKEKGKDKAQGAKKKFQKKTKQVFKLPEETRQLRKEERYPWVIEDARGEEVWVASMEEVAKAKTQAFFMPASNNTFKFVPAHRWYKFQKKPNYHIPDLEEAESLMAMRQRNKDPERWLLHKRNGQGPSAATSALFKAEADSTGLSGDSSVGQSLGPGGRRLRTVVTGSESLFGDEDEDAGSQRRRQRDLGADADYDEVPYQEDFADDEEKVNPEEEEDDIAKDMEERLQRAYMTANKQRDNGMYESDEEDEVELSGAGKAMKKLVNKLEKNTAYDSDEEKNPYASSEEEEEEEEPIVSNEPAVQVQPSRTKTPRSGSQAPSQANPPPLSQPGTGSNADSRATSPVPNHGGHAVVAKRATSPKAPKPKSIGTNSVRAGSPLVLSTALGDAPRATSPSTSSPGQTNGASGSHATSPSVPAKPNNKRKATEEPDAAVIAPSPSTAGGPPKAKKRKAIAPILGPDGKPIDLEDRVVIDWLRVTPGVTTRDCILHFQPYLRDEEKKMRFTALIKEVAQLRGGVLALRSAYRSGGSAAPVASSSDM